MRTINYVYSLQRGMGKKTAFQLAEKLDTSYSSMLSLGEWILDEKDPSKWMANDTANVSKSPSDPLLVKIEKWLTEREQIDQKFRKSFEEDFNNKFPDFLKWHQEIESHKRLSEKLTSTLISSSYFLIHPFIQNRCRYAIELKGQQFNETQSSYNSELRVIAEDH